MDSIRELLGDKPTMDLLLKVLSYTAFYAGLVYLPLRFLASIVERMQTQAADRKEERIRKLISH
jgi:hypothetical protein